ncbi:MAG: DegT/DnrJ/EryC1/StrS family aminotransferase [Nitrospirales bacterium]
MNVKDLSISWWRTKLDASSLYYLQRCLENEWISQGYVTEEFEAHMAQSLDVPYAVATTSGSMALLMALMAYGIGEGDEIIVPNRTFIATAHAGVLLGARVVLVDVAQELPLLDISKIKEKITKKTKAIMPVHLNGRAVCMNELRAIASEYGLCIIEDCCQALFSKYNDRSIGCEADAACFSFGMTKLLAIGQGGLVVTKHREIYEKLLLLRNHGVNDTFDGTYSQLGFNFKFTDIQASLGLAQLSTIHQKINNLVKVYARYVEHLEHLSCIQIIPVNVTWGEVPLYIEAKTPERDKLLSFLTLHGVQARPFLPDLDQSPHLGNNGSFPNARSFSREGIYLPGGPERNVEEIDYVASLLREYQLNL